MKHKNVISYMVKKLKDVEIMKTSVLLVLFIFCLVSAQYEKKNDPAQTDYARSKRNAVGALHIMTNHAQPIHADVKSEGETTEKPCPDGNRPSHIESGVGFQVTPPEDASYALKSLRKSLPLHPVTPTALDLVRSVTRVVTLVILFISAVCEFYPTFHSLIQTISIIVNGQ